MLSAQVAMHAVESDEADPNQLAWALISQFIDLENGAILATGELSREPLYSAALASFFEQQLPSGKWPLGQPLFHYPQAGNAYCYTFETLAALIEPALHETRLGRLLRELLKPHVAKLLKAWEFAEQTAQALEGQDALAVGWSSGHHPHRTDPEGWATASVFSYLQGLRRLVGAYARERAADELRVRTSRYPAEAGLKELVERGATWVGPAQWTASEQIAALFLHPLQARRTSRDTIDPDQPLIDKDQARSAILFGPPGTSKTTLVEALAGAIGWDFVVIHASDFLAEGMDKVPSSADRIFERLMQLDRCVVLFDEIDELLRNRQDEHADPFGRFLTTSMLPKVATLWEQRRVVFFVATNDITRADPAIKRSQRFDAAIFVAPPSFYAKKLRLSEALDADLDWLKQEDVEAALADTENESENVLGYFALLRHDQMAELKDLVEQGDVDEASVRTALQEIGDRFKKSDWLAKTSQGDPRPPFQMFKEMRESEARDHNKERSALVRGTPKASTAFELFKTIEDDGDVWTYVRLKGSLQRPPASIETDGGSREPDPILRYT